MSTSLLSIRRTISDSVHGQIAVTDLEMQIIDHPCFQRLRLIRQLGLAYLVYPAADYSRFSHSLGAMHTMHRMMSTLVQRHGSEIDETQIAVARLIALLHDIGHFPYSHLYEQATKKHLGEKGEYFSHEDASRAVVQEILKHIIDKSELSSAYEELKRVSRFSGTHRSDSLSTFVGNMIGDKGAWKYYGGLGYMQFLLSGGVDCDRLDYLMRTASVTGASFGVVNVDYLVSNVRWENDAVKFSTKVHASAAHLLESRAYDYLTSSYHKTVKSLECDLISALCKLFETKKLPYSNAELAAKVYSAEWFGFNDESVRLLVEKEGGLKRDIFARVKRSTAYSRQLEVNKSQLRKALRAAGKTDSLKEFRKSLQEELNASGDVKCEWWVADINVLGEEDEGAFSLMPASLDLGSIQFVSPIERLRNTWILVVHCFLETTTTSINRAELEATLKGALEKMLSKVTP